MKPSANNQVFRSKMIIPIAIQFLTFSSVKATLVYFPNLARELKMSDPAIAIIATGYAASLFVSAYILGRASDINGRKVLIGIGLSSSAVAFYLHAFSTDFLSLLLVRLLVGFCLGSYPSALIAYVSEAELELGRFTSFGPLGVAFGMLIAGVVAFYLGVGGVFLFSALLFFVAFLISLRLHGSKNKSERVPLFPKSIIRRNLPIYLSFLIRQVAAEMVWVYWSLYLLELGADLFGIGVLWALNTAVQFFVMFSVTDRPKSILLVQLGLILSSITFLAYGLAFDFWCIIPVQVVAGVSWALLYVGTLKYVTYGVREKATSVGVLRSTMSLSSIIGPLLAIQVIQLVNYKTLMLVAFAIASLAYLLFWLSGVRKVRSPS